MPRPRLHAVLAGRPFLATAILTVCFTLTTWSTLTPPVFSDDVYLVENRGQFHEDVLFQAPLSDARLWITKTGHVHHILTEDSSYAVHVTVSATGEPTSSGRGSDARRGYSSYFIGDDPEEWVSRARHFRVAENDIRDGVTLRYRTESQRLEYDILLAPGTDPTGVRLHFEGADRLEIDDDGRLCIHTPSGLVREHAPVVFQTIDSRRVEVPSKFLRVDDHTIGFAIEGYDPALALTIDPVLEYSTYIGGTDSDGTGDSFPGALVVQDGDIYVTGSTRSTDYPVEAGYQDELAGETDVCVSRISPDSTGDDDLVFSTYIGGRDIDSSYGIDVDSEGNVFVSGQTRSDDYPTTAGVHDEEWEDGDVTEAFVTRLNPDGDDLDYSTYVGGEATDRSVGVEVYEDATGSTAYITGFTFSDDFPVTVDCYDDERNVDSCTIFAPVDIFVAKLSAKADEVLYGTYLGGSGFDTTYGLDVDADGDVYIVGGLGSDDEVTPKGADDDPEERRAYDTTYSGGDSCVYVEGFVAKISPQGNGSDDLIYLTYLGGGDEPEATGGNNEYVFAVTVDEDEKALVMGRTPATDLPTKNPLPDEEGGESQSGKDAAFVAYLNEWGTDVDFCTYITAANPDVDDPMIEWAYGGAIASDGGIWVAGQTPSTEFPTTDDALQQTHGDELATGEGDGENDLWLARLDFDADAGKLTLGYMTYLGGDGPDCHFGFAMDESDDIYLGGISASDDFPTTDGSYQEDREADTDLFVVCVSPEENEKQFVRGDMDNTGIASILDPILILAYLFLQGEITCMDAGDANDDGFVNIADPIRLLDAYYGDGVDVAGPWPDCGVDPTDDDLDCEESGCD